MALERKSILLFTRNFVFLRNQLRSHTHVKVFVNIPKSIVNHGIKDFAIADAITGSCAWKQIWTIGHRFHSTGNHGAAFAEHDALRRQRDGLESRAADFVNGHGGGARSDAASYSGLPRRILAQACLYHVAHDDFVYRVRLNPRAVCDFGDHSRPKLGGRKRRQRALKFPYGCAYGTHNYGLAEVWLLHKTLLDGYGTF